MSLRSRTPWGAFRNFLLLLTAWILACVAAGDALAQQPYANKATAEGWVWALLKGNEKADLDDRCRQMGIVVPQSMDKPDWKHPCRKLDPAFLTDLLTKSPWREELRPIGVNITGAWIEGDVSLANAKLSRSLEMAGSLVEGDVLLESVRTDSNIAFTSSRVVGVFNAAKLRSEMSLVLTASNITRGVWLSTAKVDGVVDVAGTILGGSLDAPQLQVGINLRMHEASFSNGINLQGARIRGLANLRGSTVHGDIDMNNIEAGNIFLGLLGNKTGNYKSLDLIAATVAGAVDMIGSSFEGPITLNGVSAQQVLMHSTSAHRASFKDVNLGSARISGTVDMEGATFDGRVSLNGATVQRLFMRSTNANQATFKEVNLVSARISGTVEMQGSVFDGDLIATGMEIGGTLAMGFGEKNKQKGLNDKIASTSFKRVFLGRTKVIGHLTMEGSTFAADVSANHLDIGADLIMCNLVSSQKMDLSYSRIAGNLDARGAAFSELNLQGANVTTDLTLGPYEGGRGMDWKNVPPGILNLRNARTANLMDVEEAWPTEGHLQVDGFTFSRLGPRRREPEWWDKHWIKLDPHYTPGPYEQIAAAYTAAGDRGAAEETRFLGRVRQRDAEWEEKHWTPWLVDTFLQYVAGFGIGDYTFRVLYWVAAISVLGATYLWYAVPEARLKGQAWCFGAALSRLLPVIEINREFTDFFNDPDRRRLSGRQSALFSIIGMLGWLLGAILVAAVAGLTQKS